MGDKCYQFNGFLLLLNINSLRSYRYYRITFVSIRIITYHFDVENQLRFVNGCYESRYSLHF
jgi:hypothetical protein